MGCPSGSIDTGARAPCSPSSVSPCQPEQETSSGVDPKVLTIRSRARAPAEKHAERALGSS